jgi:PHD/YefM family antitoxin component YafN of YafNO toxin-antitoxin module
MMEWAVESGDEVIVESHGKPKVVILPFEEYERITELREQARRKAALAQLEALRESVRERNRDLDEEEAAALAERFSRDVIEEMIRDGKVKYQG